MDDLIKEDLRIKVKRIQELYLSLYGEELPKELLLSAVEAKIQEHKDRTIQEIVKFYQPNDPEHTKKLFLTKEILTEPIIVKEEVIENVTRRRKTK